MGTRMTYKNEGAAGRFSQIKLDNGTKVLVSVAQTGLAVFKVGFLGVPKGTVVELTEGPELYAMYIKNNIDLHEDLLDAAVSIVLSCKSEDEIRSRIRVDIAQNQDTGKLLDWYLKKL